MPKREKRKGEPMSDLISRQAAIEALDKRIDSIPMEQTTEILQLRKDLRELPSAQPEIVRCKDCKHFAGEGMYCSCDIIVQFDHFYCYHAERRQDE